MSDENKIKLGEQLIKYMLDEKLSEEQRLKKLNYIIRLGGDVNARHATGYSALEIAKFIGDEKILAVLGEENGKEIGLDPNMAEEFFKTASIEDINKFLKILPEKHEIYCNVDLSKRDLTELPDFSRVIVMGDFDCSYNQLTTLNGSPSEISGDFSCGRNKLKNLKGGPQIVYGNFLCACSGLDSLEGAPITVTNWFNCNGNKLKNLKGAPVTVGGGFVCEENELESLEGAPKKVGGCFFCSKNKLTTLKGAPSEVGDIFECSYNQLTSLVGAPVSVGGYFNCKQNPLNSLDGKSENIGGGFWCDGLMDESVSFIRSLNGGR